MGGFRGPDDTDAQEASSLLESEDVLEDDGYGDVLDRGYSPRATEAVGDDSGDDLSGRPPAGSRARSPTARPTTTRATTSATSPAVRESSATTRSATRAPAAWPKAT